MTASACAQDRGILCLKSGPTKRIICFDLQMAKGCLNLDMSAGNQPRPLYDHLRSRRRYLPTNTNTITHHLGATMTLIQHAALAYAGRSDEPKPCAKPPFYSFFPSLGRPNPENSTSTSLESTNVEGCQGLPETVLGAIG